MEKYENFNQELTYIKDERIKESVKYILNQLPDYFYLVPASSTGKYHPEYALGEGGLLRHTKAAVRIAYELLSDPVIGDKYSQNEKDLMLFGLMIHDGLKSGKVQEKYTKFDHPLLIGKFLQEEKANLTLSDDEITFLCKVIASHMGPWNKDYDGNEVLPVPKTKYENFVHMCDYLASRKCILVPFDTSNQITN